jgi:hypothetical protein
MAGMPPIQASLTQTAGLPAPAPEAALAQLARAALGLVQAAGQPVPAVVIGPMAGGLTQLQIGEMVLAVRLSAPLVAGTMVTLAASADGKGQPSLQVTPVTAQVAAGGAQPATAPAAASPPMAQAVAATRPLAAPDLPPQVPIAAGIALPKPPPGGAAAMAAGGPSSGPAVATASEVSAAPTATALDIQELAEAAIRPPSLAPRPPTGPQAPVVVTPPAASPAGAGSARATMPVPSPSTGATAAASTPVATVTDIEVAIPAPNTGTPRAPVALTGGTGTVASATTAAPAGAVVSGGSLPAAPMTGPEASTQGAGPKPMAAGALGNVAPASVANTSPAPAQPGQAPTSAAAPNAPPSNPTSAGAAAIPYQAAQTGSGQTPVAAQMAAPASRLAQSLADPAQAAARQDSIVPLLARLAALGPRLDALPVAAAQAALRLLAMRLEVGGLDGKALQSAVATAGVLARPGTQATPSTPTLKSALLQLRGSLSGVPGAEIEAVKAIAGRPPPPVKGDDARAVRAELPMLVEGEEPARGLLGQTDAALSRLKLLQHASQPPEARPGAAPQQELRVEVPLLIGAQTALLQLVVDRDARRQGKPGERGWRMRFAFASQQTGEVGAEVALFGASVSVALWADSAAMEAVMADGLDELRAALAAEGLEAGSVRIRRRGAAPSQLPGALMDSAR